MNPENLVVTDLLMATNGYTNGAAPALQRRFVPIGSYIIATEPLDESAGEHRAAATTDGVRLAVFSSHYFRVDATTGGSRLAAAPSSVSRHLQPRGVPPTSSGVAC